MSILAPLIALVKHKVAINSNYYSTININMSGISQIIVDPSLFGEVIPTFPAFPTQNKANFNFVTAGTNFTVPAGVLWIGAKIWGAGGGLGGSVNEYGGFSSGAAGSSGGYSQVIIQVTPGEILQVRVGQNGTNAYYSGTTPYFTINGGAPGGGYNSYSGSDSGGFYYVATASGGGGGGYSGIFTNLENPRPLVVNGGGGGGGGGSLYFVAPPGQVFTNNSEQAFRIASINSYLDNNLRGQPGLPNSNTGEGGGGGGISGGLSGRSFGIYKGGEGGNLTALFRDVAIQTNLQLSNPTIDPRKINLVTSFTFGNTHVWNDSDYQNADPNAGYGGSNTRSPGNGLIILYWNNP